MSLQNLNEDQLYSLLPSGVIKGDVRGFIQAVIGGLQDRVCDFRSQAAQLNNLIDPSAVNGTSLSELDVTYNIGAGNVNTVLSFATTAPPSGNLSLGDFAAQMLSINPSQIVSVAYSANTAAGSVLFNTVQLTYVGLQGNQITRSLDINQTTPLDSQALTAWAVKECELAPDVVVVSTVYGTDVLRQVAASTVQLLAATIGASVYRSLGSTNPIADTQRVVDGYFPRLQVKGTGLSFELLGRLIGFDDAAFVPLWGRISPRFPSDLGNPLNDGDFAAQPQISPSATLPSPTYDPNDLTDGDVFYHYKSATVSGALLTVDPSSTFYIPNAVNGYNPFFTVSVTAPNLALPQTGQYTLQGGGPHVVASATMGTSGFQLRALTEGDSFNGLIVKVQQDPTGTQGVNFDAIGRLSAIKYRTSYYDVRLAVDAERFISELNGSIPVTPNTDLSSNPALDASDTSLSFNGTSPTPYRPWKNGVIPLSFTDPFTGVTSSTNPYTGTWPNTELRVTAVPGRFGDPQLDLTALSNLGNQATAYLEDVRPATRSPRRSLTGLLVRDSVPYAPYNGSTVLFTTSTGTFNGTAPGLTTGSDIVLNGNFADADADWDGVTLGINGGISGTDNFASGGAVGSQAYATQTVTTVPGVTYTFSYQFLSDGATPNEFSVTLGDTVVVDIVDAPASSWTEYSLSYVATSTSTLISIGMRDDPGYLGFTEVSMTAPSTPASYPLAPYSASFSSGTNALGVETDFLNPDVLFIKGTGINGYYDLSNNTYSVAVSTSAGTQPFTAFWIPESTDLIRPEPSDADKLSTYAYQSRPEDQLDAPQIGFLDDYPWRRPLKAGGNTLDLNTAFTGTYGSNALEYQTASLIIDSNGVPNTINVHDLSPAIQPYRLVISKVVTTLDINASPVPYAGQLAYAKDLTTSGVIEVGAIGSVVLANVDAFTEPNHSDNLLGWWPMNEHPLDDLTVENQSPSGQVDVTADGVVASFDGSTEVFPPSFSGNIQPTDRTWDVKRGWVLNFHDANSWTASNLGSLSGSEWSIGLWLKADPANTGQATTNLMTYGPISLAVDATTVTKISLSANGVTFPTSGTLPTDGSWGYYAVTFNGTNVNFLNGAFNTAMSNVAPQDPATSAAYREFPFVDTDNSFTMGGVGDISFFASDLRVWGTVPNQDLIRNPRVLPTAIVTVDTPVQNTSQTQNYALFVNPESYRVYPGPLPHLPGPFSFGEGPYGFSEDLSADSVEYTGLGEYAGDPANKQVGFGGGVLLEKTLRLGDGDLGTNLTGDGQAVSNAPLRANPAVVTSIVNGTGNLWFRSDLWVTADENSRAASWTDALSEVTLDSPAGTIPAKLNTNTTTYRPELRFDGKSGFYSKTATAALGGDCTIVFAGSLPSHTAQSVLGLGQYSRFVKVPGVFDGVVPVAGYYDSGSLTASNRIFGSSGTAMTVSSGADSATSSAITGGVGIYTWQLSGDSVAFYFNGTQVGTDSLAVPDSISTGIALGANSSPLYSNPAYMSGAIYETIACATSLPDAKRNLLEVYLADKFGLYHPQANWLKSYSSSTRAVATAFKWTKTQTDAWVSSGYTGDDQPIGFRGNTNTGDNTPWDNNSPDGTIQIYSGGIINGSMPSPSGFWPYLDRSNPSCDAINVSGNDGKVYTLTLENNDPNVGTVLVPSLAFTPRPLTEMMQTANFNGTNHQVVTNPDLSVSPRNGTDPALPPWLDQFTGVVTNAGDSLGVLAVNPGPGGTNPFVYVTSPVTPTPSPVMMYLTHQAVINVTPSSGTTPVELWEQAGSVLPTFNGVPVAAIKSSEMSFTNLQSLDAGAYRLTVESANIGTLDPDFTGFNVEVGFGDDNVVVPVTLLPNGTGTNPTGTNTFDLTLDFAVGGENGWSLTFNWLNPYSIPARSQQRELALLGYRIDKLATSVYVVTPSTGGNFLTQITDDTSFPGGWDVSLDSGGNLAVAVHESEHIATSDATNDTASNLLVPAIDLITGSTAERREDLYVALKVQTATLNVSNSSNMPATQIFPCYDYEDPNYVPISCLNFGGAVVPVQLYIPLSTAPAPHIMTGLNNPSTDPFYINGSLYTLWHY